MRCRKRGLYFILIAFSLPICSLSSQRNLTIFYKTFSCTPRYNTAGKGVEPPYASRTANCDIRFCTADRSLLLRGHCAAVGKSCASMPARSRTGLRLYALACGSADHAGSVVPLCGSQQINVAAGLYRGEGRYTLPLCRDASHQCCEGAAGKGRFSHRGGAADGLFRSKPLYQCFQQRYRPCA